MLTAVLRKWVVFVGMLSVSALSWGELHNPNSAPEPGSATLVGVALAAAIYIATRKRK